MAFVDKEALKRAIKFYRDGLPIEVIENLTRIPKAKLEPLLGEVELTKEELLARKESLSTYASTVQEKIIQRRTKRTEVEAGILETVENDFSSFMKTAFDKLRQSTEYLPISNFKDVSALVGAMGKASEIWEKFNDAVAKRDLNAMQEIMSTMEIEVTNISVQTSVDEEGRIKLNDEGKREIDEHSSSRKITLKPLKPL